MLRAQRRVAPKCPPGFFLYSTRERLERHGALGHAWRTIKRDNVSLLHTPPHHPAELAKAIFLDRTAPSLTPPTSSASCQYAKSSSLTPADGRTRPMSWRLQKSWRLWLTKNHGGSRTTVEGRRIVTRLGFLVGHTE
jgi:hypothetical protein